MNPIKELRNDSNLTQQQFCKKLKIGQSCLSKIEMGKHGISLSLYIKLEKSFKFDRELFKKRYGRVFK